MGGNVEFSLVSEGDDHSLGTPRFKLNLDEEGLEGPDEVAQRVAQLGEVFEEIKDHGQAEEEAPEDEMVQVQVVYNHDQAQTDQALINADALEADIQ